jgi:signal transduction histidine kinase
MSASVGTTTRRLPRQSRTPPSDPPKVALLEWSVSVPVVAVILVAGIFDGDTIVHDWRPLVAWTLLTALVDLLPILYSDEIHMTMSLPLLLAAGMVFQPVEVGLIAFVGSVDRREFAGRITLARALFNRAQIGLSSAVASGAFHALSGHADQWPAVLGPATAAVIVDAAINVAIVGAAAALATKGSLRRVGETVALGSPLEFSLSYFGLGLLAAVFALIFSTTGPWGLTAVVLPLAMARQMFLHQKESAAGRHEVERKNLLLLALSERIAEERRDERARIAGSLHDDVLGALYKVHLLTEVLKQDLRTGQLLQLDDDLPCLAAASSQASDSIRDLIRDLRRSALGTGGLVSTLTLLAEDAREETDARIELDLQDVGGSDLMQLLIYQVVREALLNAVRHSEARSIAIEIWREHETIRLRVADDGVGFVASEVDNTAHFGLQLMSERAEVGGGVLLVDSGPGRGTVVHARFPLELRPTTQQDPD